MIISDLCYLETVSKTTGIVGGKTKKRDLKRNARNNALNNRGNSATVDQDAKAISLILVGGNVDDSTLNSVVISGNFTTLEQINQANDVLTGA